MIAVFKTFAWEHYRRARVAIPAVIATYLGFIHLLTLQAPNPWQRWRIIEDVGMTILCLVLQMTVLLVVIGAIQCDFRSNNPGLPRRMFTLPVPTSTLVMIQMALGALLIALTVFLSQWLVSVIWNASVPLVWPAVFMAVAYTGVFALHNLFANNRFIHVVLVSAYGVAAIRALFWFLDQHSTQDGPPLVFPFHEADTILFACGLGAVVLASVVVAFQGVTLQRSGAMPSLARLVAAFMRLLPSDSRTSAPALSPARAQLNFGFRHRGFVFPASVLGTAIFGHLLVIWISRSEPLDSYSTFPALVSIVGAGLLAFPAGWLCGLQRAAGWQSPMDPFVGTLPRDNRTLANDACRLMLFSCSLVAFLIAELWLTSTVGRPWLETAREFRRSLDVSYSSPLPWFCSKPVAAIWCIFGVSVCGGLTGRPWVALGNLVLLVFTYRSLWAFDSPRNAGFDFWVLLDTLVGIAIICAVAFAYIAAWRRRWIGPFHLLAGMLAALFILACYQPDLFTIPTLEILNLFTLAALAAAPFPLAPHAIAWNRHR